MPQLMSDAEPLKAFAGDVRRVKDAERVAVPQQHTGDASGGVRLRLDFDVAAARDGKRIDRQRRDALVTQKRLGLLLGHLEAERVGRGLRGHLCFVFFASISRKSLAISRSLPV